MSVILKIFKLYLLPNCKSDGAETWSKALEPHRDSELLKSFRSDTQDGGGGHLEYLQTKSAPKG